MKMEFSEGKGIGVVDMGKDVYVNFTSDNPIKWVMVSAKVRSKDGYVEKLTDFVPVNSFKTSIPRDIKKHMKKKDLDKRKT